MTTEKETTEEFEEILRNHLAADQRQTVLAYVEQERRKAWSAARTGRAGLELAGWTFGLAGYWTKYDDWRASLKE